MKRREFIRSIVALPAAKVFPKQRRQLVMRIDSEAGPVVRGDQLFIPIDLWWFCVRDLGRKSALDMVGNVLPATTTARVARWLRREQSYTSSLTLPLGMIFDSCGVPISFEAAINFFELGECEIVPYGAVADGQTRTPS